ncbi:MAG: hypothetical protein R3B90_06820 [Planctomycetaceae bacterium]
MDEAIEKTRKRYLHVDEYTPWQIMHGVLALRQDYRLKTRTGTVSAIEFVSSGPIFRGESWFQKTPHGGRAHPFNIPYHFEGHVNQFPALLSMSALPLDHQLKTPDGPITIQDIVNNAKRTVNTNEEITWTLWFLTQYIPQESQWVNQQGQSWSMSRLIQIQVADPVHDAPCGGTHGLFALAFARNAYLSQNGRLKGIWLNAEMKLRQHTELARQLQNADGSFSTNWFRGRGYTADFKERIKTSGHMLEWLMMALPESRLDEVWVRRAIQCVANDLIVNANAPAECGPMYHALHSLVLYRERVAPKSETTPAPQEAIARTSPGLSEQPNRVSPVPVVTPNRPATTTNTESAPKPLVVMQPRELVPVPPEALRPIPEPASPATIASSDNTATAETPASQPSVAATDSSNIATGVKPRSVMRIEPTIASPHRLSPASPDVAATTQPATATQTTEAATADASPGSNELPEIAPIAPSVAAVESGETSPEAMDAEKTAEPAGAGAVVANSAETGTQESKVKDPAGATPQPDIPTPRSFELQARETSLSPGKAAVRNHPILVLKQPLELQPGGEAAPKDAEGDAAKTLAQPAELASELREAIEEDRPIAATLIPDIQEIRNEEDASKEGLADDSTGEAAGAAEENAAQVAEQPETTGPLLK